MLADQFTVQGVAAKHSPAMSHDLPKQGFAYDTEVDEVNCSPGAFGQCAVEGYFFIDRQRVAST